MIREEKKRRLSLCSFIYGEIKFWWTFNKTDIYVLKRQSYNKKIKSIIWLHKIILWRPLILSWLIIIWTNIYLRCLWMTNCAWSYSIWRFVVGYNTTRIHVLQRFRSCCNLKKISTSKRNNGGWNNKTDLWCLFPLKLDTIQPAIEKG